MSKLGIFGAVTVTAIGSALAALNFGPTPAADQVIVGVQSDQGGGVAGGGRAELGSSGSATSGGVDGDRTGTISVTDKDDKEAVVWSYDHHTSGISDSDATDESDGDTGGSKSGSGSGTHDDSTGSATWSYDYAYDHDATTSTSTSSGSGSGTVEKSPDDTTNDDTTNGNKSDDGHAHQGEGNVTWNHDSEGGSVTWEWGDKKGTVTWDTSGWDSTDWDGKNWDSKNWDSKNWDSTAWGWGNHDH